VDWIKMAETLDRKIFLTILSKAKVQLGCSDGQLTAEASICDGILYSIDDLSMLL
jgi:hypothetical protein